MAARVDKATIIVRTSLEDAYAALVDPRAWLRWLPPPDMTGSIDEFHLAPGGTYRLTLTYLDSSDEQGKSTSATDDIFGVFLEIVPNDRVVHTVAFLDADPRFAGDMTMTWRVVPADGGTRIEFRATDVPVGISADDHQTGMQQSLRQLATYLETS